MPVPNRAPLTTREAASDLGLSPAAIRSAIDTGELAATRHGASWHVATDDLVRFARRRDLPLPLVPWERGAGSLAPPALAASLPQPSSELIGREAEVTQIVALLDDPAVSLVTLTGAGGIGKTRLALAAAEAVRDRRPGGVCFVDLSPVLRAADAVPAIAQALGLRPLAGQDQLQQIASYVRSHDLLLVIDNVEQIIGAAPAIAQIGRLADTTLLVTSRAPLRLGGEREFLVPPLPLAALDATPEQLLASDAGRLFVERVVAHDPTFVTDAPAAAAIAEICARLDGLPLAIELAAARARLLSPRQIRDRLERSLPLLTSGARDAPPRHATMRDAIAWSYDLLTPPEQRLFRQVATFAGSFTLDAVEWLAGHAAQEAGTLDHLEALLDQSLLARETGLNGEPRFRMLETIRAYGLEQLVPEEEQAFRDLHARYFSELARTLRPLVTTEAAHDSLERLAADDANLRAALAWLRERGAVAEFGATVAALSGYWFAYSQLAAATDWLTQALALREQLSPQDQARLLAAAATASGFRGESNEVERLLEEALRLSRACGGAFDLAMTLTTYGATLNVRRDYAAAAALLEEGRAVAASIADPRQRAAMLGRALANLSVTARGQGDLATARLLSEAALDCYRGLGFDLAETRSFMDLASIAQDEGNLPALVAHCQTCLARTGDRGDMRVVWTALTAIASACAAWEQPARAVQLYAAAESVRERVGLAVSLQGDRMVTEQTLATLRSTLREAQFAAAWAEGWALPLAQALAVAAAVAPNAADPHPEPTAGGPLLTRREQDVLRLLATGQTDREIADALFIGPRTVSWHVSAILGKLEARTRREATAKARGLGLLPPTP